MLAPLSDSGQAIYYFGGMRIAVARANLPSF